MQNQGGLLWRAFTYLVLKKDILTLQPPKSPMYMSKLHPTYPELASLLSTTTFNRSITKYHLPLSFLKPIKKFLHCQARYNWFCQLYARCEETISPSAEEMTDIQMWSKPEWEHKNELQNKNLTFVTEQVAYFDEIFIYQVYGCSKHKTLVFVRDTNKQPIQSKWENWWSSKNDESNSFSYFHFIYKTIRVRV